MPDYVGRVAPDRLADARARYACPMQWQADPAHYGGAVLHGGDACEESATAQHRALLSHRLDLLGASDGEAWFDAVQNARIVRAAEHYYRAVYRSAGPIARRSAVMRQSAGP